ncbi:MAG: TIGR04283 family arsenosugar biosynthesis glycosyltransferase [Deltaproteobacteria bacterium]|nr:TIGR04283 family arsenosugar biosynthesis glycosyltransferase [Deltaproteobacteria bacterium]
MDFSSHCYAMTSGIPHILILARYPVPGRVKTRLVRALGPGGSARLHRRMTEHVAGVARGVRDAEETGTGVEITICYTGASRRDFRTWLGMDFQYAPQGTGDLGARMARAFDRVFQKGAGPAVLVGTDVPGITSDILHQTLQALRGNDVVLGRAADGGYYLIGMRSPFPGVFDPIDWGTGRVYEQTRSRIRSLGLTCADLPVLQDVDRPEDLGPLRTDPRFSDLFSGGPLVSVIIPTLNEYRTINRLLDRLLLSEKIERIVADGGSDDGTRDMAARSGATVLEVSGGRAFQQNAGAAIARGRILFFLHADTLPPEGYAGKIRAALDDPSIAGGAFRFKTDEDSPGMRLVEWVTNLRSRVVQLPYGDQGLFLEKRVFDEMGGFPPMPIMEDFVLMRRLRIRGRIVTLSDAAITSARRWQHLGVVRTTLVNQVMILGFLGGMPIQMLERLYRNQSRQKS